MKNTEKIYSMLKDKMFAVLRDGGTVEIDTKHMFNNQYNTTEGKRIYDIDIHHIINDKRVGLYCCSVKQGTYEEVQQAINEERAKIEKCVDCDGKRCFWYQPDERIVDDTHKQERVENGKLIKDSTSHIEWSLKCAHKEPSYGGKCAYDIDEEPKLFTEVNDCFFVKYPNGVPDNSEFVKWLQENHEECKIVPYWSSSTLESCSTLKADVKLGSYTLEIRKNPISGLYFEISNSRDCVRFAYDFENKKFIELNGNSYKVSSYLHKHYGKEIITCWDKFKKLWDNWVSLYEDSQNN